MTGSPSNTIPGAIDNDDVAEASDHTSLTTTNDEADMSEQSDDANWTASGDDDQRLCQQCKAIDFTPALENAHLLNEGDFLEKLRENNAVAEIKVLSRRCMLCKCLKILMKNYGGLQLPITLCSSPDPELRGGDDGYRKSNLLQLRKDVAWFVVVSADRSSLHDAGTFNKMEFLAGVPCGQEPKLLRPKLVSPYFNSLVVKRWLFACHEHHSQCRPKSSAWMSNLWLIDCNTFEIIELRDIPKYVALSYVWAQDARDMNAQDRDKKSSVKHLPPLESLSAVIIDAITVTIQLGYTYLWIDKFCVDQQNSETKQQQIETMHLVYGSAELTIIASSGQDENDGLPGVRSPRTTHKGVEVGPVTLIHMPQTPSRVLGNSKWATRGWTLQEQYFSNRCLYFFEREVMLECRESECHESHGSIECAQTLEDEELYYKAVFSNEKTLTEYVKDSGDPPIGDMQTQLAKYCFLTGEYAGRLLTYEGDVLRAFAGIRKHFESGHAPIYNVGGLPIPVHSDHSTDEIQDYFVAMLCWIHQPRVLPRRRSGFPSWSWTGWVGRTFFLGTGGLKHVQLRETLVTSLSIVAMDGSVLKVPEVVEKMKGLSVKAKTTSQYLPTVPSEGKAIGPEGQEIKILTKLAAAPAILFEAAVIPTKSITLEGDATFGGFPHLPWFPLRIRFIRHDTTSLQEGLGAGSLGFVLLGRFEVYEYLGLVVQWHLVDGVQQAQRIDIFSANPESKKDVIDTEEIRKNVVWQKIRLT